jgi:hypothetical protein
MGSRVAAALSENGHRVFWASQGRSRASRQRADGAGLEDAGTLAATARQCEVLLSVCPPEFALNVAEQAAAAGFAGVYVDANAVSPVTARAVAAAVLSGGAAGFVDGGIIGLPPRESGTTRLYLSGDRAPEVAALFAGSVLGAIPIEGDQGAASALKMTYAAYTKGSAALLAGILALAEAEGVGQPLADEWALSQPDLAKRGRRRAVSGSAKAWRWAGEMEEIADTFAGADLPDGFHRAAAEIFRRLAEFKDVPEPPPLADVLAALNAGASDRGGSPQELG